MYLDDEILHSFIEETKEHLESIESDLMDMETDGEDMDDELVNSVFRAAHSIKGGAAMLGLEKIKGLAHKLENVLQMVRDREIIPDNPVVSVLLKGFDQLNHMVDDPAHNQDLDTSETVEKLSAIMSGALPEETKQEAEKTFEASVDGKALFTTDYLTIRQAQKGGKYLFVITYDLIHDIHGKNKTPLDILQNLQQSGDIVDCKMDVGSVGTLDDEFSTVLPFYVLYACILEKSFIAQLAGLDESKISEVSMDEKVESEKKGKIWKESFGEFEIIGDTQACLIVIPEEVPQEMLPDMKNALNKALETGTSLKLDFSKMRDVELPFLQLLYSAHKTYCLKGLEMVRAGELSQNLTDRAKHYGFPGKSGLDEAQSCGIFK